MIAVVEIKGGFGNQIFQYAFAQHLKNNGYKVKINFQNHIDQEKMLDYKIFGFSKSPKFLVLFFKFLYKFLVSDKTKYLKLFLFTKSFSKFSRLEDYNISKPKLFNHFDGYWQSVEILENQKEYIEKCLNKLNKSKNFIHQQATKGSTLIHVRRGDYKNVGEELKIGFYEDAINFCELNIDNFNFQVFTDDIKWVKKQKIFDKAEDIHGETHTLDELLSVVFKMFAFENYVVGNSSFSLIPAVLSENLNKKVLVAKPWFRNSNNGIQIKEDWIQIINK